MISFANPSWLYGLLGLLIPIGIHLLSRKEGKTIYVGSIRHLADSDTAQFSSIRLNEILLLLLRLILITLVVFMLAGFDFQTQADQSKQWLVIEKGIERDKSYSPTIDSLKSKGFDVRWFADEFPTFSDSTTIAPAKNYARLIHAVPSFVDTAVIMTYSYASAFKGEKPSLPPHILWLTVDPPAVNIAINAVESGADSVAVRVLTSNSSSTAFSNKILSKFAFNSFQKADTLKVEKPDTIDISIYSSERFAYDSKVILAALQAIANRTRHRLNVTFQSKPTQLSTNADFLIWLSEEEAPLVKISIGYSKCKNASLPLLVSRDRAMQFCEDANLNWVITQHLTEENVLNESLTFALAKIILPELDSKAFADLDHRTLAQGAGFSALKSNGQYNRAKNENPAGSGPAVAILLFILLITERVIAYKRKQ